MCDIVVVVRADGVLFGKNSDRDPNEAQLMEWHPVRRFPPGERVQCTWIDIPQVERTHAVLLSRPFWMWGAEMGANDLGVVAGNTAVFTQERYERTGLTGMDLVRLALERAATAEEAANVVIGLLEAHGQGGGCGFEDRRFTYHNSFVFADPSGAILLETAGRHWARERIESVRTVSNVPTIPGFAERHSDFLKTRVSQARARRHRTRQLAARVLIAADMTSLLRDHGEGRNDPCYSWLNGALGAPCAHGGGLATGTQTTASWVSDLRDGSCRHWVTATSAPCVSIYKRVRVDVPLSATPVVDRILSTLWWRHERFHRLVMKDRARLWARFAQERDALEASWFHDEPDPQAAFEEADRRLADWIARLERQRVTDRRPWYVRRYWGVRQSTTPLVHA